MRLLLWSAAVGACLACALPAGGADAERGKALFQACVGCHSDAPNPLGPNLKGVVGRKAAALEDYRYSAPMMRANLVWDEDNLKAYIADPQGTVKGNRMPYGGVKDPADLDDVIAYLKELK